MTTPYDVSEAERIFATGFPYRRLNEAKVQALVPPTEQTGGYHGGPVLDETDRIFRHHRDAGAYDRFDPGQLYEHRLDGDYTYAGPYYAHFGHFMSEMMHRIVPARMMGLPERYLFVTTTDDAADRSFAELPGYMRDVLAFCGVPEDGVLVINRNTIVERLHLVQQAATLATFPKPGYLEALRAFTTSRLDRNHGETERPTHLYVSRSAFSKVGSFLGEAYVESRLREAGVTIFRPEEHSVTVQMDHYRKARSVVFSGGSACHGTELLGRTMMNAVAYIPRLAFQDRVFQRLLKPRAGRCESADISAYLGSFMSNPDSGVPSPMRGVSIFDLRKTRTWIAGMPSPKRISSLRYLVSATRDLASYEAAVRGSIERNALSPASLFLTMSAQVLRRRRSPPKRAVAGQPRVLTDRELAAIWSAVKATAPPFGPFWSFALLTLQPHSLVADLRRTDLSAESSQRPVIWTVSSKRERCETRTVPLSQTARGIVEALPRNAESDLVFLHAGKPLARFGPAKEALDARIGEGLSASGEGPMLPWSLGDVRFTALERLEERGYERLVVRALLGFAKPAQAASIQLPKRRSADAAEMLEDWARIIAQGESL